MPGSIVTIGVVILIVGLLANRLLRGSGSRGGKGIRLFKRRSRPGDYVSELTALCYGDKSQADRLINHELSLKPHLSRNAAAMSAATRLKHDRGR
jgi:hypothetical protein